MVCRSAQGRRMAGEAAGVRRARRLRRAAKWMAEHRDPQHLYPQSNQKAFDSLPTEQRLRR